MPLPTPNPDESRGEFLNRCISNPTVRQKFPNPEQRLAVCSSQAAKRTRSEAARK